VTTVAATKSAKRVIAPLSDIGCDGYISGARSVISLVSACSALLANIV